MTVQQLRDNLEKYFSESELIDLCWDLNIPYKNLPGNSFTDKTRELIEYCQRRLTLNSLILACEKKRPNVNWSKSGSAKLGIRTESVESFQQKTQTHLKSKIESYSFHGLSDLAPPGGTVKLNDLLYVEREDDKQLKDNVVRRGSITTIRAPRQSGKSSLLLRGLHHAETNGATAISIDMQEATDRKILDSFDQFLYHFAHITVDELMLDPSEVDKLWDSNRAPKRKLTSLFHRYILPSIDELLVLGLDEVDILLEVGMHTEFFSMLRAWHNRAARGGEWEKLNIVLCISTEPHLLIDDKHQSPFNVGLKLDLTDFSTNQVLHLNQKHGNPVPERELSHFMNLLNGHPYLVRQAMYSMIREEKSWDNFLQELLLHSGPFGNHLQHQLDLVRNNNSLARCLKQVIRSHTSDDRQSLFRLQKAGLIRLQGNQQFTSQEKQRYSPRCNLYSMYFEKAL